MSCIGRGLCRILSTWMVFGDTSEEDETNRKVCALLFFTTMKKILTLIFLSVFCLNAINAETTWNLSDDGTLTISGTGDMTDYGYGDHTPWYSQRNKIKKIIIEEGVTSLINWAFCNCTEATSVSIPNSLITIGTCSFLNCGLISVTIPYGVTTIGRGAFDECRNLKSVTIPNSVTTIGDDAFNECINLTSITIPNSVTSIGSGIFQSCSSLASITIPNSVTNIGSFAFYDCSALTSITIPNSVTSIETCTFSGCNALTDITIPNSVTLIDHGAFYGCSSLTSLKIPNCVTRIGDYAFAGCTSLTSITIPASVTELGYGILDSCSCLNSIKVQEGNAYFDSRNNCNAIIEKEYNTLVAGCKNTIIPTSVTTIGGHAFFQCTELKSIVIPDNITCIGYEAFGNCTGLTSITIPNSVTEIQGYAFTDCTSLTSITISNSITDISDGVFNNCTGLTSISIPNSVTYIGYAFNNCTSLTSISIPNSVTCITDAFIGCENLRKATIDVNKELWIGPYMFAGCNLDKLIMKGETLPAYVYDDFLYECNHGYDSIALFVPSQLYEEYCSTNPWSNFAKIVKIPEEPVILSDGETYTNEEQFDDMSFSYIRNFSHKSWQALYVPFSMSYDDWKDEFEIAYINGIRQIDTNNDNVIDETIMDVFKIEEGSLIPNTPYLIRAKSIGEKTISLSNATLYPAESNSIDCSTTIAKYIFTGTYNTIPASTLIENDYYAMGGGSIIMTDGESDLKPFRWYLSVEARSPMYYVSNNAKAITIRVAGEDEEATGVNELRMTNDELPVYDLNGRRVNENNLKPGIYVKNGKKVIVK